MTAIDLNNLPLWVQDRDTVLKYSENVQWRYGEKPDYTRFNENFAKESTRHHPENSLSALVQNLVRTFDIEANFKTNPQQWISVVQDKFRMSTNGGSAHALEELVESGTYKLLIGNTQHYKASEENFETSTHHFHTAFPNGFLWEVLEVYSAPPTITFKWRHWGHFTGSYKDYAATGETIEVIGMSVVQVSDDLKILSLEHYFDNNKFLDKLTSGGKSPTPSPQDQAETTIQIPDFIHRFWGSIKRWSQREKATTTNLKVSRCPFAFFN